MALEQDFIQGTEGTFFEIKLRNEDYEKHQRS